MPRDSVASLKTCMMGESRVIRGLHRLVRAALEQTALTTGGARLVVSVSGGPDSLAMLYALRHLRDDLGLHLHGAHLDHGLRGDASRADADFVAETFRRLDIPFTLEERDVSAFRQQHGLSLEEAARKVRYGFLAKVAMQQRADAIALGHTADDQAETVLMHIIRGTGLSGLRGMEVVTERTFNDWKTVLVRPLLRVYREQTADYCRALSLKPRLDESNMSPDLRRNRVRMELLPFLEAYNPAIREALLRLSRSVVHDVAHLEAEVDEVWCQTAREDERALALNRDAFNALPRALQNHMLRRAVMVAKGDLEDLEQNHIDDMARLMGGPAGRSLDLPGGMRFSVSYTEATLAASARDTVPMPALEQKRALRIPGETLLPGWRVAANLVEPRLTPETRSTTPVPPSGYTAHLDYDSLGSQLWVRSRKPGDRFQPLGMPRAKKLQDFMVDSRIPRGSRDRVPLVVSSRGIAWVVGWRISEWARVRQGAVRQLELSFIPE